MTSALVLTPLLLVGLILILIVPVLAKLLRKCSAQDVTPEWLESFSVTSYQPMAELLNNEDFKFLSQQPGFDFFLYKKLRRERLQIFKQYLNRSIRDFNRLHMAVRSILPYVKEDSSDVVGRLVWLKLRFSWAVLKAELSYRLCLIGFHSLAVRSLLGELEAMSLQLSLVSAAHAA